MDTPYWLPSKHSIKCQTQVITIITNYHTSLQLTCDIVYGIYCIAWRLFLLLFFRYRETLPVIKRDSEEDSGQFFEEIVEV